MMHGPINTKLDFSLTIGYIGSLKWGGKNLQLAVLGYIFNLRTNKTLIHNSLHVFDNWKKILSHKKCVTQLQKEKVYLKGQADADNWRSE